MKRFIIAGCIIMCAWVVSAQNQGGAQRMEEMRAQWYETLTKELKISTAQLDSIKKFDAEFAPKQRELFEKYRDDREKMTSERTKLTDQLNAKIKKVLTADQYKKYEELNRQRMERFRNRGGDGGNTNR